MEGEDENDEDILDKEYKCYYFKAPEDSISVCQYVKIMRETCLLSYSQSGCRSREEVMKIEEMWARQTVSETEVYGDILSCNETTMVLNQTEIGRIQLMMEDKEHWHQKSR